MPFIEAAGHRLHYEWAGPEPGDAPTLVFLHQGLGSVSMWGDFPEALAEATGCGMLNYSRWGYGESEPIAEARPVEYMHDEALESLPEVLSKLGVRRPILVGHSDGGSIALIYAGSGAAQGAGPAPAALILEAAHVFVEDITVDGAAKAKLAFDTTEFPRKLGRHHDDPEGMFRGWNDIWLYPDFLHWNIEEYLPKVTCPALVIQGENDEYGSRKQVDAIAAKAGGPTEVLMPAGCGHSPHRELREEMLAAMTDFVRQVTGQKASAA